MTVMNVLISNSKKSQRFWLALSFIFAIIYSCLALKQAFSHEYVIQDDARQHVFWTLRFLDAELFPNDLIADYFQSVAPAGYSFMYGFVANLGINPVLFSKLVPLGLDLILTGYCWGISLAIFPVPLAGFLSTLLLNQYLWLRDDLVSGTPVAFIYPLFLAFVYYLLQEKLIPCLVSITLLGLFYPQGVLIAMGILTLRLVQWKQGKIPTIDAKQLPFCGTGLFVSFLIMLFYALTSSEYGPVISAEQAKTMLEFLEDGKSEFFINDSGEYWVTGQRTGIMPRFHTVLPLIATGVLIILLPLRRWFSLFQLATGKVRILFEITLASLGMFFLSHLFLFRLHLPSRYTEHSLRIVSAIAGAMAFVILIGKLCQWMQKLRQPSPNLKQGFVLTSIGVLLAIPLLNPLWMDEFPDTEYVVGHYPQLYQFLREQPQDSLVASVVEEVNNIPIFARRSILIGGEGYPVPYHLEYYRQIKERTLDLIRAYYTTDLSVLKNFVNDYGVDFLLIRGGVFTPEFIKASEPSDWLQQYQPITQRVLTSLQNGETPILALTQQECSVFTEKNMQVVAADCILELSSR